MTAVPPVRPPPSGMAAGQQISASVVNSFRVAAVAERLASHTQPGRAPQSSEFFSLCLSLARGIDYAIANNEVPAKANDLPLLLKQICQRRNDLFLQAAIMVLMISVKNACKMSWFSEKESQELFSLANEVGSCFCSPDMSNGLNDSLSTILTIMSRYYPSMKMGQILASLEAKPGYAAIVIDFNISKNTTHSPLEKIRLFVAQKDKIETSACIISPQQVNFLLNGKGVDRRTNVIMDAGPQMPTNVTAMLKYGTNLLQAVGHFWGHYIIVVAFMSMESSVDASMLPDYVQTGHVAPDSDDSDIIEGPSRISLKCPISKTRIIIPVKGHACKHLQCFDFNNYVDINSRRPSWRCPHCHQHVCYTDIRIDQNMVKVLKEVAEDVSDVIISADGSWKAVFENDDDVDELPDTNLDCQKDGSGSEQPESAKTVPIVVDLTMDESGVDAMETIEIEDRKPSVANLQSQQKLTIASEPLNAVGVNQSVAPNMEDDIWSALYLGHGSGTASARAETQVGGPSESSPSNFTVSPVFSDAPAPPGIQSQLSAASNLQLQQSLLMNSVSSHEYGSLQHMPRHINRTPIAVQALPAPSQIPTSQQISRNGLNTMSTNGSPLPPPANMSVAPSSNGLGTVSSDMERQPQFSRSAANLHQSWNQRLVPGQSVQQLGGVAASSQVTGSYRPPSGLPGEHQNLQQQQPLNVRIAQPRGPSPGLIRSSSPSPALIRSSSPSPALIRSSAPSPGLIRSPSPLLRTQTQQGAAQVCVGHTVSILNSNPARPGAATPRATQMARQPPPVVVQTQTSRTASSFPGNVDANRASADLASEQSWRPTGRMRGSLSGRAYNEALSQLMIQPTQATPAARPQATLTSPPSIPPHLQALLANSLNTSVPPMQNNTMNETVGMNGVSK